MSQELRNIAREAFALLDQNKLLSPAELISVLNIIDVDEAFITKLDARQIVLASSRESGHNRFKISDVPKIYVIKKLQAEYLNQFQGTAFRWEYITGKIPMELRSGRFFTDEEGQAIINALTLLCRPSID